MRRWLLTALAGALVAAWSGVGDGAAPVTQGQLVVALAKRLSACGTAPCKDNDPSGCAQTLKSLGLEPPGGWRLDQVVTEAALTDLTDDVIGAAKEGRMACTPQRAVDLMAAAAIDVGLGGRDVYLSAYTTMGFYFPPSSPVGGGGSAISVSPSR